MEGIISVVVIITFSTLTYCFIKKNTLEGSVEVKKAIARNLQYLMVASIVTLVFNAVPAFYSSIRTGFAERGVIVQVSLQYITRVPLTMPSVATPIVLIVLLKPIRAAMREGLRRICSCHTQNAESASTRAQ